MSEETTRTQASPASSAASNTGGDDKGPRRNFRDKDGSMGGGQGETRFKGRRRRKVSYLTINKIEFVDYKEVNILRKFINDRGKILSCKVTGNTAKQQRMIASGIRRAREMALLPFVVTEMTADRPFRPRRDYGDRGPRDGDRGPRDGDRGQRDQAPAPQAEKPDEA